MHVNTFLLFLNFLRVEVTPVVLIFVLFYLGISIATVSYYSYNGAVYVRGALQMGTQFQNHVLMESWMHCHCNEFVFVRKMWSSILFISFSLKVAGFQL